MIIAVRAADAADVVANPAVMVMGLAADRAKN